MTKVTGVQVKLPDATSISQPPTPAASNDLLPMLGSIMELHGKIIVMKEG